MLCIIQHKTSALWMRIAVHELDSARKAIRQAVITPALKCSPVWRPELREETSA